MPGKRVKVTGKIVIIVLMIVNFSEVIVRASGRIVLSIVEIVIFTGKKQFFTVMRKPFIGKSVKSAGEILNAFGRIVKVDGTKRKHKEMKSDI